MSLCPFSPFYFSDITIISGCWVSWVDPLLHFFNFIVLPYNKFP